MRLRVLQKNAGTTSIMASTVCKPYRFPGGLAFRPAGGRRVRGGGCPQQTDICISRKEEIYEKIPFPVFGARFNGMFLWQRAGPELCRNPGKPNPPLKP